MVDIAQEDFTNALNVVLSYIRENHPTLETREGSAFRELLIDPTSIGYALISKLIDDYKKSQSLGLISQTIKTSVTDEEAEAALNTLGVDEDAIDNILRDRSITRKEGGKATGLLKIVVRVLRDYYVNKGTQFESSSGLFFATSQVFTVSASQLAPISEVPEWVEIDAVKRVVTQIPTPPAAPNIDTIRANFLAGLSSVLPNPPFSALLRDLNMTRFTEMFDAMPATRIPVTSVDHFIGAYSQMVGSPGVGAGYYSQQQKDVILALLRRVITEEIARSQVEVPSTYTPVVADRAPVSDEEQDHEYFFLLPIIAIEEGTQYNISQNVSFISDIFGADLVSVSSYVPFSGGQNKESLREVVVRAENEITIRNLVSRRSINFTLPEIFPTISQVSVMGCGDREQTRDKTNAFGFGTGGKVDVYVRTAMYPKVEVLETVVPGELGEQVGGTQTITLPTSLSPIYKILEIQRGDVLEATVSNYTVNHYLSSPTLHDLNGELAHGRFSIYNKTDIVVPGAYSGYPVKIKIVTIPGIWAIQNYLLSEAEHLICADVLVRGIIPCFVTGEIKYVGDIDETLVKEALLNTINTWPIGTPLSVSALINIMHASGAGRVILPIWLFGEILQTDGQLCNISNTDTEIPTIETSLITSEVLSAFKQSPYQKTQVTSYTDTLFVPTDYSLNQSQCTVTYFAFPDAITLTKI